MRHPVASGPWRPGRRGPDVMSAGLGLRSTAWQQIRRGSSPSGWPPRPPTGSRPWTTSSGRSGTAPSPDADADADAERRRWFYTPTDHGGLTVHQQRPAQQRLAMKLVATGLSEAGYVTVATVMGLENVLDRVEGFTVALRPRTRPRPGPLLPAGVRRAGRAGAVGLAVRRAPRVAEQPGRRRAGGRHHARASWAPTRPAAPLLGGPAAPGRWPRRRTWPASWCARCAPSSRRGRCCCRGRRRTSSAATGPGSARATR